MTAEEILVKLAEAERFYLEANDIVVSCEPELDNDAPWAAEVYQGAKVREVRAFGTLKEALEWVVTAK